MIKPSAGSRIKEDPELMVPLLTATWGEYPVHDPPDPAERVLTTQSPSSAPEGLGDDRMLLTNQDPSISDIEKLLDEG